MFYCTSDTVGWYRASAKDVTVTSTSLETATRHAPHVWPALATAHRKIRTFAERRPAPPNADGDAPVVLALTAHPRTSSTALLAVSLWPAESATLSNGSVCQSGARWNCAGVWARTVTSRRRR